MGCRKSSLSNFQKGSVRCLLLLTPLMGTFLRRHGQFQIVKYLQANTDPDPIRWGRARARGRCPSLPDIDSLSISRHKKYIYDALGPSLHSRKSTLRHFPGKTMSSCITTTRQQTYRMRIRPFVNHHRSSRGSCWILVRHCLPYSVRT